MTSHCVNKLDGTIILSDATPEQVDAYIRRRCREYYTVISGFEFKEVEVRLAAPMLLGLKIRKRKILLPFTKSCHGTFLYEIDAEKEDIDFIRARLEKRSEERRRI